MYAAESSATTSQILPVLVTDDQDGAFENMEVVGFEPEVLQPVEFYDDDDAVLIQAQQDPQPVIAAWIAYRISTIRFSARRFPAACSESVTELCQLGREVFKLQQDILDLHPQRADQRSRWDELAADWRSLPQQMQQICNQWLDNVGGPENVPEGPDLGSEPKDWPLLAGLLQKYDRKHRRQRARLTGKERGQRRRKLILQYVDLQVQIFQAHRPRAKKLAACMSWLASYLVNGAVARSLAIAAGKRQGYTVHTIDRAAKELQAATPDNRVRLLNETTKKLEWEPAIWTLPETYLAAGQAMVVPPKLGEILDN